MDQVIILDGPAPMDGRPRLVITNVASDNASKTTVSADFADITCPRGTTLTFTAELRGTDGKVLPVADTFRMPISKRGGGEGMLLATMTAGIVTVIAPFTAITDDGAWLVDQATINASLPPAKQMQFRGCTVNVYRAAP
ncbi:hypothetical protein [Chitinimonas sp.]|uniref:hypothetical protein n=1 Tax=Chitinimonas sp. TaxID=1934313 RepID=UPI0035B256D6